MPPHLGRAVRFSGVCVFFCVLAQRAAAAEPEPRRLQELVYLVEREYRLAVKDGEVVQTLEYEEAVIFSEEAVQLAKRLKDPALLRWVQSLQRAVAARAPAEEVRGITDRIREILRAQYKVPEVLLPRVLSVERGAQLFQENCATCHTPSGRRFQEVGAPNLRDPEWLRGLAPLQMFLVITRGVPEGGMPSWEQLPEADRWNIVYGLLAAAFPVEVQPLPEDPTKSLEDWLQELGSEDAARRALLAPLARRDLRVVLLQFAERMERVAREMDGMPETRLRKALFQLYQEFESLEPYLFAQDAERGFRVEQRFQALLRGRPSAKVVQGAERIAEEIRALAGSPPATWLGRFTASFVVLFREGLEVILVLALVLSVLRRFREERTMRWVWFGAAGAVVSSVALWQLLQRLPAWSGRARVALEAGTLLLASAVLVYVVFWSAAKVRQWRRALEVRLARGRWGTYAAFLVGFAAVLREGLETVLFYQAMALQGREAWSAVIWGAGVGILVLAAVGVAILRFSVRLPLERVFQLSSLVLMLLALTFVGRGVYLLQLSWQLPLHWLPWEAPLMAPTWEALALQVLVLALFARLWITPRGGVAPA